MPETVHHHHRPEKGLIAYDFLYCRGGAEHVTLTLARNLAGAGVCVDFRNREAFPDDSVAQLSIQELGQPPCLHSPGWRTLRGLYQFSHRAQAITQADWVVFSGANAPVAVHQRPRGRNLYYCHTLPRFAYDLHQWYLQRLPRWQRPAFRALTHYVRNRYERALADMDRIMANSDNVRRRLQDHIGVHAEVVHPPCDTEGFHWLSAGNYYLSTARLEPYKRVDLLVQAFRRMPEHQLIITSGGSDLPRLQQLADGVDNIHFTGWVDDTRMRELVGHAAATLYMARDEDFGMSPVESMAAGKPVIAPGDGGLLETVVPGKNGVLLPADPTVDDIVTAITQLPPSEAARLREDCEERASQFNTQRFIDRMEATISATASPQFRVREA